MTTNLNYEDLEVREFAEGSAILTEGGTNSDVYVLKEGAVLITISGEEICRICTPEAMFGEVSALLSVEASATVKTVEASSFWIIKDFRTYLSDTPDYAVTIAEELARRLSNMSLNFIEVRSTLKELRESDRPAKDESKKIVLDKYAMDEIKRIREEKAQEKADNSDNMQKVDKILRIRIDG